MKPSSVLLLTNAVQTLAGVLLPSETLFPLLLCNDREVLGPRVNGHWVNLFTGAVVAVLVMLSPILTGATPAPSDENVIMGVLGGSSVLAFLLSAELALFQRRKSVAIDRTRRAQWQMPPLDLPTTPVMSASRRT